MTAENNTIVLGRDDRCWRPYLLNGATPFVYWLLAALAIAVASLAGSVTRFAPGAALPQSRLAVLVVPDPADPGGQAQVIKTGELAAFRSANPGARLAPDATDTRVIEPEGKRSRRSYRVEYSARNLGAGTTEVTLRSTTPFIDSPGGFGYLVLRYTVAGERIEPQLMLAFDPFGTWLVAAFIGFFAAMLIGRTLEIWLIDRPLAQGRWRMQPPLNRDWLVTRGIPLRFAPPPPSLEALAAALRHAGAKLRYEAEQGALAAEFGQRAVLTVNLRRPKNKPPALDVLIDGGMTPTASLLLVLVAPLAGLTAGAMALFAWLDPFARLADSANGIAALAALAGCSAYAGWRWLRRPGLSDEADRLASILLETMATAGAHYVPVPSWPRLTPPLPKWRRWLPRILFGLILLLAFGPALLEIVTDLLR